jgi:hypothetical protein
MRKTITLTITLPDHTPTASMATIANECDASLRNVLVYFAIDPTISGGALTVQSHITPDAPEWSGSPCPIDPDNYWIDDATGERIAAR